MNSLQTPPSCTADFCILPLGTSSPSIASEIAAVQLLLKESGLDFTLHSAGTTVEGSWEEVMTVIGKAHSLVHGLGVARVQSSVRVGTRTDKVQTAEEKVKRVQEILAQDEQ